MMIVSAILAILLTLAVPSYRDYSLRAHRMVAITELLQATSCQERVKSQSGFYNTHKCIPADDGHYSYQFEPAESLVSPVFLVIAVPIDGQSKDPCGTLSLASNGEQNVGSENANAGRCWSGR